MSYTPESIKDMAEALPKYSADLISLQGRHAFVGDDAPPDVKEHLVHGAGRRLSVLRRTLANIFQIFPPTRVDKLNEDELSNVQINLHAHCINVAGIFDNWAWAFVLRHRLLDAVGGMHGADFFGKRLRRLFPAEIAQQSYRMSEWQSQYLKGYRDSLAHRIPLYVPPFSLAPAETKRYRELEAEKRSLLFTQTPERYEEVSSELESMGRAAAVFLHSFEFEGDYRPVSLHGQILADCATVVECGDLFLRHWSERA